MTSFTVDLVPGDGREVWRWRWFGEAVPFVAPPLLGSGIALSEAAAWRAARAAAKGAA